MHGSLEGLVCQLQASPDWSFHTKPLSPSAPSHGMGSQPAGTPDSARAMKYLPWEAGQTFHLFRTGKEPRAVLCLVFHFHWCFNAVRLRSKDVVDLDG